MFRVSCLGFRVQINTHTFYICVSKVWGFLEFGHEALHADLVHDHPVVVHRVRPPPARKVDIRLPGKGN